MAGRWSRPSEKLLGAGEELRCPLELRQGVLPAHLRRRFVVRCLAGTKGVEQVPVKVGVHPSGKDELRIALTNGSFGKGLTRR